MDEDHVGGGGGGGGACTIEDEGKNRVGATIDGSFTDWPCD